MKKSIDKAVEMLRRDHAKVSDLFVKFENAGDEGERKSIADNILSALSAHALAEEQVFYPALGKVASPPIAAMLRHAKEEHGEMKQLITRIRASRFETGYEDMMETLKRTVLDHVEEEEASMLPEAESKLQEQAAIAAKMLAVKTAALAKEKVGELSR